MGESVIEEIIYDIILAALRDIMGGCNLGRKEMSYQGRRSALNGAPVVLFRLYRAGRSESFRE